MLKKYLVFGLLAATFVTPSAAFAKQTQVNAPNTDQVISDSGVGGYSYFANQCGLSISGRYINDGNQDAFQVMFTFNTNPCTNQNNLEKLRQENESKRELTRSNAQIIITCINARLQSVQKDNNPDVICKLTDFPIPK